MPLSGVIPCARRSWAAHRCGPTQPHRTDSPTMSGPQTAPARATLAASPSNSLESPCQKARSRLRAVLHPAVSTVREVSACSASRVRSPNGIVARHARYHPGGEVRHRTGPLSAASAGDHGAVRGGSRQSRDPVRCHRRWGACRAHPPPCPEGTPRLPRLRASLPRLCPTEMPWVQGNPTGGFGLGFILQSFRPCCRLERLAARTYGDRCHRHDATRPIGYRVCDVRGQRLRSSRGVRRARRV